MKIYCKDNRISYADVNNEIVDKSSFRFTSYDNEKKEYSGRAKLLYNDITAAIEEMGQSISENEKRQILIEILERLCK